MTYGEAKRNMIGLMGHLEMIDALDSPTYDSINISIDALEKQIPKKPNIEIYENRIPSEQEVFICPCCGDSWNENEYGSGMKFCWECGQAIDWSEVTE